MRTQADRDDDLAIGRQLERKDAEIDRLRKIVTAYEEYTELLASAERDLLILANSHGYKTPAHKIERGNELRAIIAGVDQQNVDDRT